MKELFIHNRQRLAEKLPAGAFAVVHSNDVMPTNADGTHRYLQNSDLYYLTGILQEETILVVFPDYHRDSDREILFINDPDPHYEMWNGKRLTKEDAQQISGIANVQTMKAFPRIFKLMMSDSESTYLTTNEDAQPSMMIRDRNDRFARETRERYPLHHFGRLSRILRELRMVKSPIEISLLREAARVTGLGFERILRFVKPGVKEYEVEAEMVHEYLRNGARVADYQPIVASGGNACTLHYIVNDQTCSDGDLLLIDAAAGYKQYNADMTRTIPVNGKFSQRQKAVYEAVLRVHKSAKEMMLPGLILRDLQNHVIGLMGEELGRLGLLTPDDTKQPSAIMRYFPHGNSHFLGLDVHDVGQSHLPLPAGTVLTNEPGIYIREEGIGIRLENNVVLTESGPEDLMADIPIESAEIEERMAR